VSSPRYKFVTWNFPPLGDFKLNIYGSVRGLIDWRRVLEF